MQKTSKAPFFITAPLKLSYLLITSLLSQNVMASGAKCENLFGAKLDAKTTLNSNINTSNKINAVATDIMLAKKTSASWEISRQGVGELIADLHGLDNVLYYAMTALMAKEHILVDGPGGGAKTLGIRKLYEAQLRTVNVLTKADQQKLAQDTQAFKIELLKIISDDKNETDPQKKIFTQQFHATLSETKLLGGPDPFKFVEDGKYEIDYSKALISEQFLFGIIDEIEKGPVSLQMTLLSILNERQALVGNKVVQTMLESIAATTNATLGELISQALPHEIGGRRALIDRFSLKVHSVNVSADPNDLFLMLEKIESSKGSKKFTIVDVRGLRPLMNKVKISDQLLSAMTDITTQMDRFNTDKLVKAQEEVKGTQQAAAFFPAFSGSSRTQSKVLKLWTSAFLIRQLMQGVPFESIRLNMSAKDLIDVAPAVLQGGPDSIIPEFGHKIHFVQSISNEGFVITGSNSKNKRRSNLQLSEGYYDPNTELFQYVSAKTGELRIVKYDIQTKKIVSNNPEVLEEIAFDRNFLLNDNLHPLTDKYIDLAKTLGQIQNQKIKSATKEIPMKFKMTGRLNKLLNGNEIAIRKSSELQLKDIAEAHDEFLDVVNVQIAQLKNVKHTYATKEAYARFESIFESRAARLKGMVTAALKRNDRQTIEDVAALTVKMSFDELSYRFLEAGSNIKSIYLSMLNRKNVMLFGPPGSAKTMLSRMILEAELKNLSEAQVSQSNSILADALLKNKISEDGIWVKQFHPMSNEGDVVGRVDLKAVRDGQGYTYNRTGSMSAKNVLFTLLDEFEKAPAGVKTALLSLLNERELLDGDEVVKSNIIAVVIATNATPGEFMTSLGDFSTAFPIFDRIQNKAYSINKLTLKSLSEFHRRMYLGFDMSLKSPLMIHPLNELAKQYKLEKHELRLLAEIHQSYISEVVKKSNIEREMHNSDPQAFPDYFMNSRGESNRSVISVLTQEFAGSVLLNKILTGIKPREIRAQGNTFDPTDLVAFSELYSSFNGFYKITHDYDANGMIYYKVVENDLGTVMDRIDNREKKTIEDMKFEADTMASVLNKKIAVFIADQKALISSNPSLYPRLFSNSTARTNWQQKMVK